MPELSWAPRWPLAAASRREITEAALTSLSAHATTVPSPSPPPSPDPFPPPTQARPAFLPTHPPWTRPRCEPSQICQMMASSCRTAPPANSYQPFFSFFWRSRIPPSNLHHQKSPPSPPPHPPTLSTVSPFAFPQPSLPLPHLGLCFCLPHQRRTRGHGATGMEYKCSQLRGSMGNQSSKDSSIHFTNSSSQADTYSAIQQPSRAFCEL